MISSSPRTFPQFRIGIVHFLAISKVPKYSAFISACELGNTLLCLFRSKSGCLHHSKHPLNVQNFSFFLKIDFGGLKEIPQ